MTSVGPLKMATASLDLTSPIGRAPPGRTPSKPPPMPKSWMLVTPWTADPQGWLASSEGPDATSVSLVRESGWKDFSPASLEPQYVILGGEAVVGNGKGAGPFVNQAKTAFEPSKVLTEVAAGSDCSRSTGPADDWNAEDEEDEEEQKLSMPEWMSWMLHDREACMAENARAVAGITEVESVDVDAQQQYQVVVGDKGAVTADIDDEGMDLVPMPEIPQLSSVGSQWHDAGVCRPCNFMTRADGCRAGESCKFCHLCSEQNRRRRKRERKRFLKAVNESMDLTIGQTILGCRMPVKSYREQF